MRKYRWLGLVAAILIILGACWRDRITSTYELKGVCEIICQEDVIYISDNNGDTYHLFSVTMEGEIIRQIELPKLDGSWWNEYKNMAVDQNQVYVYAYGTAVDSNERRSRVYRCDWEQGSIELMWELPPDKMFRIQVIDGILYYLASEGETQTAVYRHAPGQEGEQLYLLDIPFERFKSYYYKPDYGVLWTDWNSRFYYNDQEIIIDSKEKKDYVAICVWDGGIMFTDMGDETIRRISWEDAAQQKMQAQKMCRIQDVSIWNQDMEYVDLYAFHIEDNGNWTTGIDISPERRILGIFDETGNQILELDNLHKSKSVRMKQWLTFVCICIVVMLVVGLAGRLVLILTNGMVPILFKLLSVLIPIIMLASLFLNHNIQKSLEEKIFKMNYDLLYNMAEQTLDALNPEDLMKIETHNIPEDPYYQKVLQGTNYCDLERAIYSLNDSESKPIIGKSYQWMFLLDEDVLRFAQMSGQHYYGAQVLYDRDRQEIDKMNMAMTEQCVVRTEYNDSSGDFIALYVPIIATDGQVAGILESGLSRRVLDYDITEQMEEMHKLLAYLIGILVVVLVVVLGAFLYPLIRLRVTVEEMTDEKLGTVVKVRGKDEVSGIGAAFNHMSVRLKEQVDYVQACSDGYETFVPKKVFEILGREDITQVELGDQEEILMTILDISSSEFLNMAKSMDGEQLYGMINRMLEDIIPIVTRECGVVDHMREEGLTVYYLPLLDSAESRGKSPSLDSAESLQALKTAISICERLNHLKCQNQQIPEYRMVIDYGLARVGIIGQENRMAAATISEIITLSSFLQEVAERYGIRVLITESAVNQIAEFSDRFHARMIGYLYMKKSNTMKAVYDVYDGDEIDVRRAKENTKELFERALSAYFAEEYYDARLKFAEVLRKNPRDLTARAYVYRCDEYYQTKDKSGLHVYLEQYG